MKALLTILVAITFLACSSSGISDSFLDCENINEGFKNYDGEEIDCEHHYRLTKFNNQNFIELHAHCDDLVRPFVFNENCEDICENDPYNPDSECGKYLAGREVLEILLIQK